MFQEFLSFIKKLIQNIKKSPLITAICCIVIIIPTALAVFFAYFYEDDTFLSSNYIEVVLYDADGEVLSSSEAPESDLSGSELVNIFYKLDKTKALSTLSIESARKPTYKVTITSGDETKEYSCYFTSSHEKSFLGSSTGELFSLDESYYNEFLNSAFSKAAYPYSTPPSLITSNGEHISPLNYVWNYKKQNKQIVTDENTSSNELKSYVISGGINLSFDTSPDKCEVTIFGNDSEIIYNGNLAGLSFVTVDPGQTVVATVIATWNDGDTRSFFGQLSYSFNITVTDNAQFSVSRSELLPSEFIVLSVKNADDISKIVYRTIIDIDEIKFSRDLEKSIVEAKALEKFEAFKPIFVADGDSARAILPFSVDMPEGTLRFEVSCGAAKEEFAIKITEAKEYPAYVFDKNSSEILFSVSEAELRVLNNLIQNIPSPSQHIIFFRGSFASLEGNGFDPGYTYNSTVFSPDGLVSFVSIGNEYLADAPGGSAVPALNIGVVVARGECSYLGNYVVVDHGMGLRTWYCCLSDINVDIGDVVKKGDPVGKCGTAALTSQSGTFVFATVYDVIIDVNAILGKEISF